MMSKMKVDKFFRIRLNIGHCSYFINQFDYSHYTLLPVLYVSHLPSGKSFLFLYVGYFLSASFFNLQDILLCKEDCHPH